MTQDIPLPEIDHYRPYAEQFKEYAAACVAQATQPLLEEIERLTLALDVVDRQLFELANRRLNDANASARTIDELRATIERQQGVIEACRGSVKADLVAYEQMQIRKPMSRLPGGVSYNEVVETEIKRLADLLDSIDSITALQDQLPKE